MPSEIRYLIDLWEIWKNLAVIQLIGITCQGMSGYLCLGYLCFGYLCFRNSDSDLVFRSRNVFFTCFFMCSKCDTE